MRETKTLITLLYRMLDDTKYARQRQAFFSVVKHVLEAVEVSVREDAARLTERVATLSLIDCYNAVHEAVRRCREEQKIEEFICERVLGWAYRALGEASRAGRDKFLWHVNSAILHEVLSLDGYAFCAGWEAVAYTLKLKFMNSSGEEVKAFAEQVLAEAGLGRRFCFYDFGRREAAATIMRFYAGGYDSELKKVCSDSN